MHVIWDWNGTLLADLDIVVAAVNDTVTNLGGRPIDADGYRKHYTRPVSLFYERLLDRPIGADDWDHLNTAFHTRYVELLDTAALAVGAHQMLESVAANGQSQSVLSMAPHDLLVPLLKHRGIADFFVRVDGAHENGGDRKTESLHAHLEILVADHGVENVVMVGDALDDAAAAKEVGIDCILYAGGSHDEEALVATGFPVISDLRDAPILR